MKNNHNSKNLLEKMMADNFYQDCLPLPTFFPFYSRKTADEIANSGSGLLRLMPDCETFARFDKNNKISAIYRHGSEDSTDTDAHYVIEKLPPFADCKRFCDSIKGVNANLITIENGVVADCYKGTPDEINNALVATYHLHEQFMPLVVDRLVKRDVYLKLIRSVRGILSHLSRTQYRNEIKDALKSGWRKRLDVLGNINLAGVDFDSLGKNTNGKDVKKVVAFQIGQTVGLMDGVELYTKNAISQEYPVLKPYLYREDAPISDLADALVRFVAYVKSVDFEDCVCCGGTNVVIFEGLHSYDLGNEKKVGFPR